MIHFLISVASIFWKYLLIFQKDEPLIHILHTEYVTLLQQLMGRFLKASYLLLKLPLTNIIIRCCKVLQPLLQQEAFTLKGIRILGKRLLVSVDIDSLSDEWKLYQLDDISLEFFKTKCFNENSEEILWKERVDHYWRKIELMKNAVGDLKYPLIIKVVKAALSLAHGNAELRKGQKCYKRSSPSFRSIS